MLLLNLPTTRVKFGPFCSGFLLRQMVKVVGQSIPVNVYEVKEGVELELRMPSSMMRDAERLRISFWIDAYGRVFLSAGTMAELKGWAVHLHV